MELSETEFRKKVSELFREIEKAFEAIDPDAAECEHSQGALTIRLGNDSRCILSTQPSVRQIWMALAAKGVAFHFEFQPAIHAWMDDKGKGIELRASLRDYLKEVAGLDVSF